MSIACVIPFFEGLLGRPSVVLSRPLRGSRDIGQQIGLWTVFEMAVLARRCGVTSCELWSQPEGVYSSAPPAAPRRARLTVSLRSSSRWKIKGRSSVQRWMRQRRRRLDFLQMSRETSPEGGCRRCRPPTEADAAETRKLLRGGSVSQLGPKPLLCATPPPRWRVGSQQPLVSRPICHGQTAGITFQLSP